MPTYLLLGGNTMAPADYCDTQKRHEVTEEMARIMRERIGTERSSSMSGAPNYLMDLSQQELHDICTAFQQRFSRELKWKEETGAPVAGHDTKIS